MRWSSSSASRVRRKRVSPGAHTASEAQVLTVRRIPRSRAARASASGLLREPTSPRAVTPERSWVHIEYRAMASASSGVRRSTCPWKESKMTEICGTSPPSAMNTGLSSRSEASRSAPLKGKRIANISCQCGLTKPGRIIRPRASMVRSAARCSGRTKASTSATGPTAITTPSSARTAPSGTTLSPASAG